MIPLRDRNPSGTLPLVTIVFVLANFAVWMAELSALAEARSLPEAQKVFTDYAVVPARFIESIRTSPQGLVQAVWRATASMFMHGGWLHIIFNMWFLWIFGDNVEDRLGHWRYALFYLGGGYVAVMAHVAFYPASDMPLLGASGAVAAVLGAYALAFPAARIITFIPPLFFLLFELPAFVLLILWFLLQVLRASGASAATSGVAWTAHVAGFLFGAIMIRFLPKREGFRVRFPGRRRL